MFRVCFFVIVALASLFSRVAQAQTYEFASTYQQWIDPNNSFIDYFTVGTTEQARVVFIGSSAFGLTGPNDPPTTRPTVSEGMGYGLLLAVANDDQATFDKFLNYIIAIANSQGCSLFSGTTKQCLAPCPFLMPWLVNEEGDPFWYLPSATSTTSYFSSGSATDADIQIAWALQLASKKVAKGTWTKSTFPTVIKTMTYLEIFEEMAIQIRLNDIGLRSLRYNPGSQWGGAGSKIMYPGYFTPQAFLALNKSKKPNISHACPDRFPTFSPNSSLKLVFKNNATRHVSIDYLGGDGTFEVGPCFVPTGQPNQYTIGALQECEAIFTPRDPTNTNATIQATHYSPNGFARIRSNYTFTYTSNSGVWAVANNQSTPHQSILCQSPTTPPDNPGNVVYIFLTQPKIKKIDFSFKDVLSSSLTTIFNNQERYLTNYQNTLLPNVIYYSGKFPHDNFSYLFGFDSCRFALWAGGFLQSNPFFKNTPQIKTTLELLLASGTGVADFIQNNTLPSGGIDILNKQAVGNWDTPAIPLNATVMTGAAILGGTYQSIYDQLSPPVLAYQIVNNQPSVNDPQGDSGPYYNAVMVLLSEAILNKKL